MATSTIGPCERAWLCNGFVAITDPEVTEVEVIAVAGEVPILLYPERFDTDPECVRLGLRELAHAAGPMLLYLREYGWLSAMRALGNHAAIAAATRGYDQQAAD